MSEPNDPNVTPFPTAKEREALEKARFVHRTEKNPGEPILKLPPAVKILVLMNIAVFALMQMLPEVFDDTLLYTLTFVPSRYFGGSPLDVAALVSPFTHMFIHAGWIHILMNVGMLMAFGAGLEQEIGVRRLVLFYFVSGLCGALLHALVYHASDAPMLGASGAVSGLFGGIVMMAQGRTAAVDYKKLFPFVAVWIGTSVFFGVFGMPGVDNPIAWTTHIGGFLGGMILFRPVCRLRVNS